MNNIIPASSKANIDKIVFYCIVGTMLEWYDFAIFGVLSSILAAKFFPSDSHSTSLLFVFAVFATAFLMRPFGAIFFGHVGDKYGRKKAIVLCMSMMAIATLGFSLLPTPSTPSIIIIVLFIFFRLVQGFSVGGETAGIVTLIGEITGKKNFYFYQGIQASANIGGILIGMLIGFATSHAIHHGGADYLWRLPFTISVLLAGLGLYLRLKAMESPIFLAILKQHQTCRLPIRSLLKWHKLDVACYTFLAIPNSIAFYYMMVYYPNHIANDGISKNLSFLIGITAIATLTILDFVVGAIVNKCKNDILFIRLSMLLLTILPLLTITINHPSDTMLLIMAVIYGIAIACSGPIIPAYTSIRFDNKMRYTGTAICDNLSKVISGSSPFVFQWLVNKTGLSFAPNIYLAIFSFLVLMLAIFKLKLSQHTNLTGVV